MKNINEDLNEGIVLFTGYGLEKSPSEYPERVSAVFKHGDIKILDEIKSIFNELDQLKPDWSKYSLKEAGDWAKNQMQMRHPGLSNDALNALEWTFTWWWK